MAYGPDVVSVTMRVQSLAWLSGLRIPSCHKLSHRCGSDLVWLWLWHRLAAIALIQPLAWEQPYAAGAALKQTKDKKKKKNLKVAIK